MVGIIVFAVCVLFALATYGILYQLGVIPGSPGSEARQSRASSAVPLRARTPLEQAQRGGWEMSEGCLISVLAAAGLWFLLWGVVLILALRFLSDPFG